MQITCPSIQWSNYSLYTPSCWLLIFSFSRICCLKLDMKDSNRYLFQFLLQPLFFFWEYFVRELVHASDWTVLFINLFFLRCSSVPTFMFCVCFCFRLFIFNSLCSPYIIVLHSHCALNHRGGNSLFSFLFVESFSFPEWHTKRILFYYQIDPVGPKIFPESFFWGHILEMHIKAVELKSYTSGSVGQTSWNEWSLTQRSCSQWFYLHGSRL